ncbi:MAG: flagellar hook protein FlgE [Candidatus Brocadiales bacterium]|uniref:flagellar hook protein FlgE n=1 Tax=Candidatus Wunengus sp. YC60 TaxID=3367697 RepID=UPI0027133159|nr:flagellar hook protein FlgE [Candidatus Brocadiales bacterium]
MGLGGALYSGVSGIRAHQNMLDVIGNNLANINTYGYKSSRLLFSDLLSQTMSNGSSGNPMQVGKGVKIGNISSNFSQGTLETTNNALDFAIQGEGFFVVSGGDKNYFTRVGSFDTDENNNLIDSNTGYKVVDTNGKTITIPYNSTVSGKATSKVSLTGNLDASAANATTEVVMTTSALTSSSTAATSATTLNSLDSNTTDYVAGDTILITGTKPNGTSVSATYTFAAGGTVQNLIDAINTAFSSTDTTNGATASIDSAGKLVVKSNTGGSDNLSVTLTDGGSNTGKTTWTNHNFRGATYTTSVDVYDSQGTKHTVTMRFVKVGDNKWDLTASMDSSNGTISTSKISGITFNSDGSFSASGSNQLQFKFNGISSTQSVAFNLGTSGKSDGLTQNGGDSTAAATSQDGYEYGTFDSVSVDSDGTIKALYTNGITQTVATLKIALFSNLNGLSKQGDNLYAQTSASGEPIFVTANSGRAGAVSSGYLEGSNVDMATELTSLITAQRGFQLNTKVITTADEILSDIVNLKR